MKRLGVLLILALVAVLAAPTLVRGDGRPAGRAQYGTGKNPCSVATGLLDGDGHLDLVVANSGTSNVSVLLGNGDGSFQTHVLYEVEQNPRSVAVGDLDGDGNADIAVANSRKDTIFMCYWVSVLLGEGDGTFAPRTSYAAGKRPSSVAIASLGGDSHLDLVVAACGTTQVSVLLGNGDGTFGNSVEYEAGENAFFAAVGRLDGDAHADIAVANVGTSTVSVLLGNGDGTFDDSVEYDVGMRPSAVSIGDLDGDGSNDLAVVNAYPDTVTWSYWVSVLLGNGDGSFQERVGYEVGAAPYSVAIGQLDEGGDEDLVVANCLSSDVSVLLGEGDGTFEPSVEYITGPSPYCVAIDDLDGDGDADLVAANSQGNSVSVLIGNGDGTFGGIVGVAEGLPASFALAGPNPFTSDVTMAYTVPSPGAAVVLRIHDVAGRSVRTLVDRRQAGGDYRAVWDGRDNRGLPVASGVYFCRAQIGEWSETGKVVLIR
jgi:hypothetical protein